MREPDAAAEVPSPPPRAGVAILRSRAETDAAAAALDARGLSVPRRGPLATRALRIAARLGLGSYPLGAKRWKAWDVWRAVSHCLETVPRDGAIVDVGAWRSEVLWALARAGFRDLLGCDTDPRVRRMPGRDAIRYVVADFFDLAIPRGSLAALTCLSVIEHGVDAAAFFARAADLLRPGGRLVLTTDYWPTPIDTAGVTEFGRPWTILTREGLERWLAELPALGLEPDGPVDLTAAEAPIRWSARSYTFAWLALRKRDGG